MKNAINPITVPPALGNVGGTATVLSISDYLTVSVVGQTAAYSWAFLDANNNQLVNGSGNLTVAQYTNWGTQADTTYIPQCVAANLSGGGITVTLMPS